MKRHAIFLSGPIGAGKTTLGRALAERLAGGFIDGDDHLDADRPWYCSILQASRAIVDTGLTILDKQPVVVIAHPLGCTDWIYFRRKFADAGVELLFVSLRASYAAIVAAQRGRLFDEEEHARIKAMIAEGYDARPFSDLIIDTDNADFATAAIRLECEVRSLINT